MSYDANADAQIIFREFAKMLEMATRDGGRKREHGSKFPWWADRSHERGLFSHIAKWKRGERVDVDSGAHPLIHVAWRALALAYQEINGMVEPGEMDGAEACDKMRGR